MLLILSAGILYRAGQYITSSIQATKDRNEQKKQSEYIYLVELDNRIAEFDRITSMLLVKYTDPIGMYLGIISDGDTTGYYKSSIPEFKWSIVTYCCNRFI